MVEVYIFSHSEKLVEQVMLIEYIVKFICFNITIGFFIIDKIMYVTRFLALFCTSRNLVVNTPGVKIFTRDNIYMIFSIKLINCKKTYVFFTRCAEEHTYNNRITELNFTSL